MPTTRRLALAGALALFAGALPHLPASAEATPAIVFRNAGNHSGGASVDIDVDASLHATGVRYSLADGTGRLDSFVISLLSPDTASLVVDPLRNGRDYTLTAQLVADGTPVGAPASTALRGVPRARLFLGTARQAKGATLPFTVQLSAVSAVPVPATVQVDWSDDVSTSVPVTVAAGSLTADGSIAVPSGLFADAARHPVSFTVHADPDVLDVSEAPRSTAVWGSQSPTPITVKAADLSAPEGDDAYTHVSVAATLDAAVPAPGLTLGVTYEGNTAGYLTFPAGQKSAEVDTVVPADTVPGGDHVQVLGFDLLTADRPVLLPASVTITTVDDDPDGAVPQVDAWSYGSQRGTGVSTWAGVTFVNAGNRTLTDATVTGEIQAAGAQVLPTGPLGACTVGGRSGGPGVAFSCPVGTLAPGQRGSLALEHSLAAATIGVPFTARLTGTEGSGGSSTPRTASAQTFVSAQGPTCTVTGGYGAATVTGTSGDDVMCGPVRAFGTPQRWLPGAGNDVIRGTGILDYSQAPGPIKDVKTGNGLRVTGWGTDDVPWRSVVLSYDAQPPSVIGTAYGDTFGPNWSAVSAGDGKDVIWLDPWRWSAGALTVDGGPGVDIAKIAAARGVTAKVSLADPHLTNVEQLVGGAGNDVLSGNAGANVIRGGGGDDTIDVNDGLGGNDTVVGGAGVDTCKADVGDKVSGCEKVTWVPVR